MKQKITIKVVMNCEKCREKTMQIAATAPGVISVSMKDDVVTVEGNDVDSVTLTGKLRKKVGRKEVGSARLIGVEEIKEKKKEDAAAGKDKDKKEAGGGDKKPAPQPGVITYHQYPYAAFPPPPPAYYYGRCYNQVEGVPVSDYDNSSCSIM